MCVLCRAAESVPAVRVFSEASNEWRRLFITLADDVNFLIGLGSAAVNGRGARAGAERNIAGVRRKGGY